MSKSNKANDDSIIVYLSADEIDDEEITEDEEESSLEYATNISLDGSPLYPRIFVGESAKPLMNGPFPETQIVDDNITNTWRGLLSFYG